MFDGLEHIRHVFWLHGLQCQSARQPLVQIEMYEQRLNGLAGNLI